MRFIFLAVSLALLILVSCDPNSNLKNDLLKAAENTKFQIEKMRLNSILAFTKLIVDSKVADQAEIEKFQNFYNQWVPRNVSFIHNATQLSEFEKQFRGLRPKVPEDQLESLLDQYTRGSFSVMKSKHLDSVADEYEAFKTKGTEIIRVAKESGYTDNIIERRFDDFVRADRDHQGAELAFMMMHLQRENSTDNRK